MHLGSTLSLLALLLVQLTRAILAQNSGSNSSVECEALPPSSFCSSWIGQPFAATLLFPSDGNSTSIQKFDNFTRSMLDIGSTKDVGNSLSILRDTWSCPNWDGTGLRYVATGTCGLLSLYFSSYCSDIVPPCELECKAFSSSIKALFEDPTKCDQTVNRTAYYNALQALCDYKSSTCAQAVEAEQADCGFSDSKSAQNFCSANSGNSCCKSTLASSASKSTLSTGAIVGIVIGGICCILLAALLAYGISKYSQNRKQKRQENKFGATHFDGNNSYTHQDPSPLNIDIPNFVQEDAIWPKVWQNFEPTSSDEIRLCQGDQVQVHKVFSDMWAWGVNLTTGEEGAFPYTCVQDENSKDGYDDRKVGARNASLYGYV